MGGGGGGAWKVAYADFVTAMMAFFLVMWIVAQSQDVKKHVAQHFKDPFHSAEEGADASSGNSDLPYEGYGSNPKKSKNKAEKLSTGPKSGLPGAQLPPSPDDKSPLGLKPHIIQLHDGQKSAVGSLIVFDETSVDLDDTGKEQLRQFVALVLGKPNKIEIRGHTSRRRLPDDSPYKDAWALSYERCQQVLSYLEEAGVEPRRIRLSQAAGFEPYSSKKDAERQAKNSRVEIYMLNEYVNQLTGTEDERGERFR